MNKAELRRFYTALRNKVAAARAELKRPLTLAEKIVLAHLDGPTPLSTLVRGTSAIKLRPDRVAMQDATAQMAMLQFIQAQTKRTAVPASIHCDHIIRAYRGAKADMATALTENAEVYDFLSSAAQKYGIDFWRPGSGIIHQVVLENYALPGTMMIGTDSHTPNAGGLGMVAIGVGGADAAEVMAGLAWDTTLPKLIGIRLTGAFSGWTSPKDVILKVAGILTVKGGTGKIVEYFGPGVRSISATGRATITNMGAELGATTSIFPFDEKSLRYLEATERSEQAQVAKDYLELFSADSEVEAQADKYFDEVYEIDLSRLEPHVVGPHTPDLAREVSALKDEVPKKGYPNAIRFALIGSCTNSSYEDIGRAAHVAAQAADHGLKAAIPLMVSPGSEAVFETIKRDGYLQTLESIGATVLANACGPCIGQWKRDDIKEGERNTIVTSFNRNFRKRNDGNAETLAFIGSPEIVTAYAISGELSFNPLHDSLKGKDGDFKLSPPHADELPAQGLRMSREGLVRPSSEPEKISVAVRPDSERLALLQPFPAWDGSDITDAVLLLKAAGKCTTDAISPAGPWLKYRGHLDKISDNMFSGALNAFTNELGKGVNILTNQSDSFTRIARAYKAAEVPWVVVGDENYGERSSREHAAMCPRYLGARAVIVRSFARIHETNLKKQGVLALLFVNSADYDKIAERDRISITGLREFAPGKTLSLVVHHENGSVDQFTVRHTYTEEQIGWFKSGGAMNARA